MRTKNFIYVLAVCAMILSFTNVNAKGGENGRFSVGAEVGLPMGDFGDAASTGFGGSLRYEMPMGDNLGLTLTAGYLMFGGKTVSGFDLPDWSMIPVQLGAKYYFTEQQSGFYGMVEVGIHSLSYKIQVPHISIDPNTFVVTTTYTEESQSATKLSYAPAIGYHLDNLDFALRYQMVATEGSTTSYLGLRLAYVFGSK